MGKWSINKAIAPKDYGKFKRWYKAACNLPNVSVEEAYKSLGYELPKKPKKDVGHNEAKEEK